MVFVPAWNEAESVAAVVTGVRLQLPGATVLVVDDGSSDETAERARAAGAEVATLPFNAGLGTALQTGYRFADERASSTSPTSTPTASTPRASWTRSWSPSGRAAPTWWSAAASSATRARFRVPLQPSAALWILLLARLLSAISGQRFTDITSGFRAGDRRAIELFSHLYQPDFGEIEALQTALSEGLAVKEVPVVMLEREAGASYLTVFHPSCSCSSR